MRRDGGLTEEARATRQARNATLDTIFDRGHVAATCGACDAVGEFVLEDEAEAWLLVFHPRDCPGRAVH
jgi:hypothetical protein